tara:strand:- start:564 stop:854 length:291 start_codon:yes stop_codon:yes gene_type:complete
MCDTKDNYTVDIIGYAGGIILSICLAPQIYKIIKTKEVENISYLWQFMYILGIIAHLYYGIYYNLLPIYVPSIVELCLIIILFILKVKYQKEEIEL